MTFDELRQLFRRPVYAKKDSKTAAGTLLPATDASDRKGARDTQDMSPAVAGERIWVCELHHDSASNNEGVKQDALGWNPRLKDKWASAKCSSLTGMVAALSARAADICNTSSGKGISPIEEQETSALVKAARTREMGDWEKFGFLRPANGGVPLGAAVDARWALMWKRVDGRKDATVCLVAQGYQVPDSKDECVCGTLIFGPRPWAP